MKTVATAYGLAEWREGQAGTAELYNLVATPRGEGHGATLLNEVIAQMKTAGGGGGFIFGGALKWPVNCQGFTATAMRLCSSGCCDLFFSDWLYCYRRRLSLADLDGQTNHCPAGQRWQGA